MINISKKNLILGITLVGVTSLSACSTNTSSSAPSPTPQSVQSNQAVSSESPSQNSGQEKVFTVESSNFTFDIKEIKVKKGDKVKIVLKNKEGLHDWVVDEFNGGKTKQLKAGEEDTIEFVADKVGTFEYYCSVMKHRQMGMVGKLIVEE